MRAVKSTPTRLTLPLHPSQRSFPGIAGSQWSASPSGRRSAAKEVWQTWWTRWNRRNSWSWPRQSKTVGTSSMESHNSLEAAKLEPCGCCHVKICITWQYLRNTDLFCFVGNAVLALSQELSIYPQHTNILSVQFVALGWRILSHLLTLIYVYVTSTVLVWKDLIWFVNQKAATLRLDSCTLTTATVTVEVSLTTFHDVDEKKWWCSRDLRWHIADF